MGILYYLYRRDFSKRYSISLYKKIFTKYRALDKIILNKDIRFILTFWQVFTAKYDIKTVISIAYYP